MDTGAPDATGYMPTAVICAPLPSRPAGAQRDALWEHGRNSLGIARLLVQERRPEALVATACTMAVEAACRAGLEQAGFLFDGDVARALGRLSAPREIWSPEPGSPGAARLAAAERVVGWVADYLRREVPGRSWGY